MAADPSSGLRFTGIDGADAVTTVNIHSSVASTDSSCRRGISSCYIPGVIAIEDASLPPTGTYNATDPLGIRVEYVCLIGAVFYTNTMGCISHTAHDPAYHSSAIDIAFYGQIFHRRLPALVHFFALIYIAKVSYKAYSL